MQAILSLKGNIETNKVLTGSFLITRNAELTESLGWCSVINNLANLHSMQRKSCLIAKG